MMVLVPIMYLFQESVEKPALTTWITNSNKQAMIKHVKGFTLREQLWPYMIRKNGSVYMI